MKERGHPGRSRRASRPTTDDVGETLLDLLQRRFPDSSKTTLRQMLQSDRVRVNGAVERDAKRVIGDDDRVDIASRSAVLDPRVRILFEDDDLIVINKASGLNSVAPGENAEAILNAYRPVHVVHRLDRDTSGVLVFAKNAFIRDRLQELFAAHDIERIYIAIVHGALKPPAGTFRSFLAEDRELRVQSASEGKEAITHYRTTAKGKRYSILELTLETGRRNQIRVHLSEAGHPVLGDTMYGRRDDFPRLALHAKTLGFVHPRSGKKVKFEAAVPREFGEVQL